MLKIEERCKMVKSYKYTCIDLSILKRLGLEKYWEWASQFIPMWMAPNVVTLIGLILMVVVFGINLICDKYDENNINVDLYLFETRSNVEVKNIIVYFLITRGIYFLNGLAIFVYSTLDCIDGKHARKTGSSSPLGQMFDHGVDSLCLLIISYMVVKAIGGSYLTMFLSATVHMVVFYGVTMDEYYTDSFFLGYINGPTEGVYISILVQLITFFLGRNFWFYLTNLKNIHPILKNIFNTPLSILNTTDFNLIVAFLIIVFLLSYSFTTIKNRNKGTITQVLEAYIPLIGLIVVLPLYTKKISNYENTHYKFFLYMMTYISLSINFGLIVTLIIFSHLSRSELYLFNYGLALYLIGWSMSYDIFYTAILVMIGSIVNYTSLITKIIKGCEESLNIKCFKIKDKKK